MRKHSLFILAFFTTTLAFAQSGKNDNGNQDPGGPRTNKILPHGNVGIGTLTPSEKLEVVGNVLISDQLTADEISSVGFNTTNLTVSQDAMVGNNLLVDGNVGIGVSNPSDKLEVNGNLRVSATVFSNALISNQMSIGSGAITTDLSVGNLFTVNGNTGLGVASPTERLEVAGNAAVSGQVSANSVNVVNGSVSTDLTIGNQLNVSGNTGLGVAAPTEKLEVAGNAVISGDISSATLSADVLTAGEAELNRTLKVVQNAVVLGNMGIGVENPTAKLQVSGDILATSLSADEAMFGSLNTVSLINNRLLRTDSLEVNSAMKISGATYFEEGFRADGVIEALNIRSTEIAAETFRVSNELKVDGTMSVPKLTLSEMQGVAGSPVVVNTAMAVGTTNVPEGYQLAVNGAIMTTAVEVRYFDEWPDYVFKGDYRLRSLEEVEAYIKEEGHLPAVPSAAQVKEKGYDMAEMDAALLEKVEELTLYMIELKKENQQLRKELDQMKSSR